MSEFRKSEDPGSLSVSVLIAARNEWNSLPNLIRDLEKQNYPQEKFEIILIDDHSDVPVETIPQIRNSQLSNLRVIRLQGGKKGKKMALIAGVKKCNFDFLLFTDADCRVSPGWISSFVSFREQMNSDFIIGLVDHIPSPGIMGQFYRIDFLSMIAAGAGAASIGHPTLCNGANMAVKKELYLENIKEMNLQQKSGDDVFLLHSIKRDPGNTISILKSKDALVLTNAPASIRHFLSQRLRWASKAPSYKDLSTIVLGVVIFTFNLSLLGSAFGVLSGFLHWKVLLSMSFAKLTADYILLFPALNFFGRKKDILFLPLFQLFYPVYICITAIMSMFLPNKWKNR